MGDISSWKPAQLDRAAPFYVAGHRGMVGSAIVRKLKDSGFTNVFGRTSAELDLTDREAVFAFMRATKPKYVVLAAAKVGGIMANSTYPADFLSINLQIQVNVMDAATEIGVERLLFMGSSCIYPKFAEQPIKESALMTGHLERTNDAYAIAKIAGIMQVQATRRQHGLHWISAMPCNLYGPGDNYSEFGSHVIPALIRRYVLADQEGTSAVVNWGSGSPLREFLHVDDLATASLHLLENYDDEEHINVGSGVDQSIREIAELVSEVVGYRGSTDWDSTKPDGTPRKLLDISRIQTLGWSPKIELREGLVGAVTEFREDQSARP